MTLGPRRDSSANTAAQSIPFWMALLGSRLIGLAKGDVVLTRDEVAGLNASLLVSSDSPTGETRLSKWLEKRGDDVGRRYASELRRHFTEPTG